MRDPIFIHFDCLSSNLNRFFATPGWFEMSFVTA